MKSWTDKVDEEFRKNKNPICAINLLFNSGFFDTMFKNIGLSNNYTEDDLDTIHDYFKNRRDLSLCDTECVSRVSFALYICKIAETNHKNITWRIENLDKVKSDFQSGLVLEIKGKDDIKTRIFPIVKLGKIAFTDGDNDADLRHWYNVALKSGDFIYKIAKDI